MDFVISQVTTLHAGFIIIVAYVFPLLHLIKCFDYRSHCHLSVSETFEYRILNKLSLIISRYILDKVLVKSFNQVVY